MKRGKDGLVDLYLQRSVVGTFSHGPPSEFSDLVPAMMHPLLTIIADPPKSMLFNRPCVSG